MTEIHHQIVHSHLPLLQVQAQLILQLEMLPSVVEHSVIFQDLEQPILQPLRPLHRVLQLLMLLEVLLLMLQQELIIQQQLSLTGRIVLHQP